MDQEVINSYRMVCSACLSVDRNLYPINGLAQIYQVFRLLMYDFAGDRLGESLELQQLVCWECLALLKKVSRFKQQVHAAQEHLRALAMDPHDPIQIDHTYLPQTLSTLNVITKHDYDKIYFDYTTATEWPNFILPEGDSVKDEQVYDVAQAVRDNINLDMDEHMLQVPQIVVQNSSTGMMSHLVVGTDAQITQNVVYELKHIDTSQDKINSVIVNARENVDTDSMKVGYVVEYMSENEMQASREEAKLKVQYASASYKCELCVIGFYTQHQVEGHFVAAHRSRDGVAACKVCYAYFEPHKLQSHIDSHYLRYVCKMCHLVEYSSKLIGLHVQTHKIKQTLKSIHKIGDSGTRSKKKKLKGAGPHKPGDLRKLLSKTTIEGYQCLECDMFFKNSRARKNHVARFHREGLQCDICKKRFVNKTTLATHLRLHEGPLPREECPICHKMVRTVQLKYHIQRHNNKENHECVDCGKVFSHLATYHAHLKYSRAHANENVFKFPCPMCNKGYPTKEQMQDHFNYQHLGRTAHKCPICNKPIASKANVEKHMMRVHGDKKDKPRPHRCHTCGKAFTDRKALTQHEVIHSGDRPLSCEICHQTFKQKASLYTHRKRVHKVFPVKRSVEFMDTTLQVQET